jgi:hypothetical protein
MDWLKTEKYPPSKEGRYIVSTIEKSDKGDTVATEEAWLFAGVWWYMITVDLGNGETTELRNEVEQDGVSVTHYMQWPEHPSKSGYHSQGLNPSNES